MWTLKDYREAYGDQLKDYSDLEIADAVRQQQYPDMPAAEFYKGFGIDAGRGAIGRGLAKGLQQNIGAVVEGIPAIYKSLTGDEEGARQNLQQFQQRLAETEARNPTRVKDFTEIPGEGIGDTASRALSYAGESFGQLFPSLALVLAGGGVGGMAAGAVGRAAGATAAGMALNTSESFANLSADGTQRPTEALIAGTIKSALDALPAVMMLRRGAGELGERAVEAATARIAQRFGVGTAKDAGLEGLTEGAQDFVDQTAERLVGLSDSYDFVKMVDSGIRGTIGAGPVAAVGEAMGRSADRAFLAAEDEKVQAANAEAERLLSEQRAKEDREAADRQLEEFGPQLSQVPEELLARGDEMRRAQLSQDAEYARTEEQTARQVPARIDQPGVGMGPETLAQQTRMAETPGQPFGAEGQTRRGTGEAAETQPTFIVTPEGEAYEAVSRPPPGPAPANRQLPPPPEVIPPGPKPFGGMPPRDPNVQDADFEMLTQRLLEGPATPDTAAQATTTLNAQAQAAASGIAELAPELAADVEAMLGTVNAQQTQKADGEAAQQAQAREEQLSAAQSLQIKLEDKLAKAKGPVAKEVQAAGPVRVLGTVADATVFEAGGKLYRTPVGSAAKILRLKGLPPGFKPMEGAQPTQAAAPAPELVEQLTSPTATTTPVNVASSDQSAVTPPQPTALTPKQQAERAARLYGDAGSPDTPGTVAWGLDTARANFEAALDQIRSFEDLAEALDSYRINLQDTLTEYRSPMPVIDAALELYDSLAKARTAAETQPQSKLVKAEDAKPQPKAPANVERGDKILRDLEERRETLQRKLFDRNTKPADKDKLRDELVTTAAEIKKRQQALAKKAAASQEQVDERIDDDEPAQPEPQAQAEPAADAAQLPADPVVAKSDVAVAAIDIEEGVAMGLLERIETLPETLTAGEAAAAGVPGQLLEVLTPDAETGKFNRADLEDIIAANAKAEGRNPDARELTYEIRDYVGEDGKRQGWIIYFSDGNYSDPIPTKKEAIRQAEAQIVDPADLAYEAARRARPLTDEQELIEAGFTRGELETASRTKNPELLERLAKVKDGFMWLAGEFRQATIDDVRKYKRYLADLRREAPKRKADIRARGEGMSPTDRRANLTGSDAEAMTLQEALASVDRRIARAEPRLAFLNMQVDRAVAKKTGDKPKTSKFALTAALLADHYRRRKEEARTKTAAERTDNTEALSGDVKFQPSPTGLTPGEAYAGEILALARKLNPDTILSFDPKMKWAGLAWDDKVVMGQKGTREQQILTAYHEVGGHALGHMGKLSPREAAFLMSPAGQKALKDIILQAIRDGHPTLSVLGREGVLKHIKDYGPTEALAFGTEAAAWYEMQGKPVPGAPKGFRAFVNRVLAAISALADAWGNDNFSDVVRSLGFSREHTYLADILSGKFGKRSKGKYPPLGATSSIFAAQLGYADRRYAEIADAILDAESSYYRALAAGNYDFAKQIAARMAQLRAEAEHVQPQPSPAVTAGNEQQTEAAIDAARELERSQQMAEQTPDRLPWYMKAASPGFVAQMRPKLKPLFAAINNVLVPWNIFLENGNRVVDRVLLKAKPADLKAVTRLMEAANSARLDPTIDINAGTATLTVPDYADYMLKGSGLRHKIFMSKPGDVIKLSGEAYNIYHKLTQRQQELRMYHVNSLLARAGIPDMSLSSDMTDEAFDAQLERARRQIEASDATEPVKQMRVGALAMAARAFEDRVAGYMPMVRSGDWLVRMNKTDVKSAEDRTRVFAFKSRREADKFAAKMMREEPGWRTTVVANQRFNDEMLKKGRLEDALDAAQMVLENALANQRGRENVDEALKLLGAAVDREKLNISVRGLRARNIKRRDIAGHIQPDENGSYLGAAVRPYLSQLATQTSYNVAHPAIVESLKGLPPDLQTYGQRSMVDAYLEPELWVARAKAGAFAWTIGGNLSSMLLNLPQLVLTTAPTLGSMFGTVRAWNEIRKAFTTSAAQLPAASGFFDPTSPAFFDASKPWKGLSPDEQYFMSIATMYGMIDQGLATEASGLLNPEGVRNQAVHITAKYGGRAVNLMGKMFGLSEQLNRATTMLAAYRMAKNADPKLIEDYMQRSYGGSKPDFKLFKGDRAAEFALAVMQQTQGVFNKANRPVWMQGWMGIPTQFMQFPLFMIETIVGTFLRGPDGKRFVSTPQGVKFLGNMFAGLWALGGIMAFPMAESADELLKKLTEFLAPLGVPKLDFEKAFRDGLADVAKGLGFDEPTATRIGEAAARGLSRSVGIDISRRVSIDLGLADLFFNADPTNYLGPFGSITLGSLGAARDFAREGNDTLALMQFAPVFARNLLRGAMLRPELAGGLPEEVGLVPRGGGDIIGRSGVGLSGSGKASIGEGLSSAIGFTPTRIARERERVEEDKSPGAKDRRERVVNLAADYLFFAQRAQEAGRPKEADDYRRRFRELLADTIEADKNAKDLSYRVIRDADSFRTSIAQRLEQRRSGQLGPAGAARGKVDQYLAAQRAKQWVPE